MVLAAIGVSSTIGIGSTIGFGSAIGIQIMMLNGYSDMAVEECLQIGLLGVEVYPVVFVPPRLFLRSR